MGHVLSLVSFERSSNFVEWLEELSLGTENRARTGLPNCIGHNDMVPYFIQDRKRAPGQKARARTAL